MKQAEHWVREIAGWAYFFMAIVALSLAVAWLPPDDAFAGTLRDVYVADVRTDQIGKPEQRRECGEVAYDQSKLVLFHHCRGCVDGAEAAKSVRLVAYAGTTQCRSDRSQPRHQRAGSTWPLPGVDGAEPSLGG